MIEALLGRKIKGKKATLKNYGLFLQSFSEIPLKAQSLLQKSGWGETFLSYIITPCKTSVVHGTLWEMTQKERDIIGEWELHNLWYTPVRTKVRLGSKILAVQTEILPIYSSDQKPIQTEKYLRYPNSKKKMLIIARNLRKSLTKKNYFSRKE